MATSSLQTQTYLQWCSWWERRLFHACSHHHGADLSDWVPRLRGLLWPRRREQHVRRQLKKGSPRCTLLLAGTRDDHYAGRTILQVRLTHLLIMKTWNLRFIPCGQQDLVARCHLLLWSSSSRSLMLLKERHGSFRFRTCRTSGPTLWPSLRWDRGVLCARV